jgi:hypothetical protein
MPESPRFVSSLPSLFYIASLTFLVVRWLASKGLLKEAERSVARAHEIKQQDVAGNKFVQNVVNEIADQVEVERRLSSGWISCFNPANKTLNRTLL